MLSAAVVTLLGIKLPMPKLPGTNPQKTDVLSIFTLGVVSGITSACCAPVLIGILTLTFLSPNYFGALTIGSMYVLGMVTPLLLISIFLAGKMPAVALLRKNLATINILGKQFHILTSNLIASFIFFVTGWLILALTLSGRLKMSSVEGFTKMIQNTGSFVNGYVGGNLTLNVVFALGVIGFIYWLSKKV